MLTLDPRSSTDNCLEDGVKTSWPARINQYDLFNSALQCSKEESSQSMPAGKI